MACAAFIASAAFVGSAVLVGCGGEAIPPPEDAVAAYTDAVKRGDARALHALLTERGRAAYSEKEVEDALRANQQELVKQSASWRRGVIETHATLWSERGDPISLVIERDEFRLEGAGLLPARAATPEAALAELRAAVRARSLPLILSLLVGEKREELESVLTALDEALDEVELAVTTTRGERAEIELPSGVRVVLIRVDGAWRVEEIE